MRFVSAPLVAAAFFGLPLAAQATVHIRVDLASQTMHVDSGAGDFDWRVSTGRPGHRTPTGVYHPQRLYKITYSRKYDNAPMPDAIFFSGGYAIHGTYSVASLGQVASHGCIRLSPGHAAELFGLVKREGATIVISGAAPGGERHGGGARFAAEGPARYRAQATVYAPPRAWRAPRFNPDLPAENW